MARFTSDILKLTNAVGLPDPSPSSYNDTKGFWSSDLNAILLRHDSEFALTYAGDPNGNVSSTYVGRRLWDTTNKKMWSCSTIGNASVAVWEGVSGSGWINGAGVPDVGLGSNGTYYLNISNGDVYVKVSGAWGSPVTNIKGPTGATGAAGAAGSTGATGAAGAAGSVWRNGSGVPSNGTGVNGDYYLDTATGDVYLRSAGTYSVVANIKGPSSTNELAFTANNCAMAVSLTTDIEPNRFDYTKHRSVPTTHRGIYVGLVNGYFGTNQESNGFHDFKSKVGLNINGRWVRGKHVGDNLDEATVPKAFGLEWWFFDTHIPPDTDFYTCIRREANDAATSVKTLTGFTNANPCVVTVAAGHSYLAGEKVRLSGILCPTQTGSITAATQANPCVITSSGHGLSTDQHITITGVVGMTQLNNVTFKVTVIDANTYSLRNTSGTAINSSGYGAYGSGGTWTRVSELNYANNGSTAYTVANPTATTFELTGVNATAFATYASGGTINREYNWPYSTSGQIFRGDGSMSMSYATGSSLDYTVGVGLPGAVKPATVLPLTASQINGSGQATSRTKGNVGSAPVNGVGALYTNGLSLATYFGPSGVNQPGSLYKGTEGIGGYTFNASGLVSSFSSSTGAGLDPENPPPVFVNGGGGFGGSAQAVWGPQFICGTPDDPSVQSAITFSDSIGSHGSVDTTGDIFGNTGLYLQAIGSRLGVANLGVSGESMAGWLLNSAKQLGLLDGLVTLGVKIDFGIVALGTNDFLEASVASLENTVAGRLGSIATLLKAHGVNKVIATTVLPCVTGTYTTLGGQTPVTVGGNTLNYQSGGRVEVYNDGLCNGTLMPANVDGLIDAADVLAAPAPDRHRFRVDSQFTLQFSTGVAHTNDGIHPNMGAGIPYAVLNLNLSAIGINDARGPVGNSLIPGIARVPRPGEAGEPRRSTVLVGGALALTNGAARTINFVDLTEGIWDVGGQQIFSFTSATVTDLKTSISQVDNVLSTTQDSVSHDPWAATSFTGIKSMQLPEIPQVVVPRGMVKRIYSIAQCSFSGTVAAYGTLWAVRAVSIR